MIAGDDPGSAGLLPEWLHTHYRLHPTGVTRIAGGTQTDNFRVEHHGGTVMVKVFRPGADLTYERAVLSVTDSAARAGIPMPRLHLSDTGQLLHEADGTAAAVWQWCDGGISEGPVTTGQAHELGRTLARLHTHLQDRDDGSWPVAQPHYRRHTLNQTIGRFTQIARHIEALPAHTGPDEVNLDRIRRRLIQLQHMPGLLASATPPRRALVHGDYVRPNWLLDDNGGVRAVIDMRLKYDEPVREIGRMAFDIDTIAASDDWIDVAEAALTGYLAQGGIVAAAVLHGCARLALLHSLCSTYPIEDLYRDPPPAHLRDSLTTYWANRTTAVEMLLAQLSAVDAMVTRITRLPAFPTLQSFAIPDDPRELLPVAAAARAHLQDQITSNARTAGVKALLLHGSGAAGTADPLSDIDLIAVVDDSRAVAPPVLLAQLVEPAPLLFSTAATPHAPAEGFYRGICAEVAGWPIWTDIHLWPADTAVVPADATVVFDHLGLQRSPTTYRNILDTQRVQAGPDAPDEPGAEQLLGMLNAAKHLARGTATADTDSSHIRRCDVDAATGIGSLDRWLAWCRHLADSGWNPPGWQTQILRRTTKSTTARVASDHSGTVVKLLTGPDPYQSGLFGTETTVYRTLATQPGMPMPQMRLCGHDFLIMSALDAEVLHPDRYPRQPLPSQRVRAVLRTLAQFAARAVTLAPDTDTAELLHQKATSMLTGEEADAYQTVRGLCRQRCPAHGDAIPSNLLIDPTGACTLIDFENTSWHLPGYDYAVLRCVLADQPHTITDMIDQFAVRHAGNAAYTANLITAAARELRLHTFFPHDPTGQREHVVGKAWTHARQRLLQHPAARTHRPGAGR